MIGAALALLVLVGNGMLAYVNITQVAQTDRDVEHTYAVLAKLEETLSTLKDAETGQRGYIITADLSYRKPYDNALVTIRRDLADLRDLLADNPPQQANITELEHLTTRKIDELQRVLDCYPRDFDATRTAALPGFLEDILLQVRARSFDAARAEVRTNVGYDTMEQIRKVVGDMEAVENQLLRHRQDQARRSLVFAQVSNGVGVLAGLTMVGLAYYLFQRDRTAELRRANRSLQGEVEQRAQAEARVQSFAEELQRSNRELQQFAAVASHDLQEPLRKIQAFGDRLKTKCAGSLGEAGLDYLQRMQAASARMATLITDLLTYSRVTTRQQPFQPVDLDQVAQEVIGDLEARIQQTQGRIELGALPTLDGDPVQIRQLLQNLLGNALKFHKPGVAPLVKVESRLLEGRLTPEGLPVYEISVEDNGIGFEEIYLDRIFGFFQRLHGRTEYEGTGMGLAICRRIVERHGGQITARSKPGEGSTFLVTLPGMQPKEKQDSEQTNPAHHHSDGR
jgi:signal transduction histidine kinase